ncbi:MAG: ABC transporter permease subunit [Propionibacteriaceae bacterium]|jgi:arabinogalactan oligomer/maltooligosaccharide transport system permease protein|nr:ABC transporter permease subunit [Propionibacteriaceae bacterium]
MAAQDTKIRKVGAPAKKKREGNIHTRRVVGDVLAHVFLAVMSVIWLIPVIWIFFESFNKNTSPNTTTFFPTEYTFDNYIKLFTETDTLNFAAMFFRTLMIAIFTCAISLFFVLSVAYCMSRLRFIMRKPFMNFALVLGMFPGIMSVIIVYFLLQAIGLQTTSDAWVIFTLTIVYSAGTGAGFYVMKGFMDTIPMSLDEAATLDGCTKWQVFTKIILPVTKPMIVYQAIIGFLAPWLDFVMAKVVIVSQAYYTVAPGMWLMLQKEYIYQWFARFAAAAVCVSIPIAILFIVMQRFYAASMAGSVKG